MPYLCVCDSWHYVNGEPLEGVDLYDPISERVRESAQSKKPTVVRSQPLVTADNNHVIYIPTAAGLATCTPQQPEPWSCSLRLPCS